MDKVNTALNLVSTGATVAGALAPKRELEDLFSREHHHHQRELEARKSSKLEKVNTGLNVLSTGATVAGALAPKRELEVRKSTKTEKLNTALTAAGAAGAVAGLFQRELEDLFSRELENRANKLEAVNTGLTLVSTLAPMIPGLGSKPKREETLFSREPLYWDE